jgi:hypothetical protein
MQRLQRIFLYLAVIAMPIQDCILGKSPLGYVGSNLSAVPLAIHGMIGICIWISRGRLTISRCASSCLLYISSISLIYLLLWGPVSHGGSVIYKIFSGAIVLLLCVYAVFYVDYTPSKGLRRATYISFLLLILGAALSDLGVPGLDAIGQSQIVHITPDPGTGRWRGFSNEPSMFSATVVSLGIAAAYLSKGKKARNTVLFLTLTLLLLSQSKGALLVLSVSGFLVLFLKRPSFVKLFSYLALCSIATALVLYFLFQQQNAVVLMDASITFATRISMAAWTFIVIAHHPFGVGLGGFYRAITIYLPRAMDWVSRVSPLPLNFSEVQEYVGGNMTGLPLDTKCFMLEYIAMFGVPFIVVYFAFARLVLRALLTKNQNLLLIGFVFLLIGMSTYVNGLTLYAGFYLVGLAYREHCLLRNKKSPNRQIWHRHLTKHSSIIA